MNIERAGHEVSDGQHIYNKALFDATNEALKELLPPYTRRVTDAQRRVRRHQVGSRSWQGVLQAEAVRQVLDWMTPRDDIESLLLEDLKQVCRLNRLLHCQRRDASCFGS